MNWDSHVNDDEMDDGHKRSFKNKISDLLEVSPSDADASSKITKTKTGYLGVLRIFSSQGKFIVKTTALDLDVLVKSLFQKMYGQMKIWRTHRLV